MMQDRFFEIANDQKADTAMGRFEIMAQLFNEGTDEMRAIILSAFDEEEAEAFMKGAGLLKLFTDARFYKEAQEAVCDVLWSEFNK